MILFPLLNADLWTPTGGPFLATATDLDCPSWVSMTISKKTLVFTQEDTGEEVALHKRVGTLYPTLGTQLGDTRLSVTMPIHGFVESDAANTVGPGIGDPSLVFHYHPMQGATRFGYLQRITLPLGAANWQLGEPGLVVDLQASFLQQLGSWTLAANYGPHLIQQYEVGGQQFGSMARFRLGAAYAWSPEPIAVSLELAGQHGIGLSSGAGVPIELVLGGQVSLFHVGISTGITQGIGMPRWRVSVGIAPVIPGV